jgi:hypothetical protein
LRFVEETKLASFNGICDWFNAGRRVPIYPWFERRIYH